LKHIAAVLLLAGGPFTTLAAAYLACWFWFEGHFYFKFHVNLFMVMAAGIAATPTASFDLSLWSSLAATPNAALPPAAGPAVGQWLIVVTVIAMYYGAAFHKMGSRQARTGVPMFRSLQLVRRDRRLRSHRDGYYPRWLSVLLVIGPDSDLERRWRVIMAATIALQLALPILLLNPQTWLVGAVAGAIMHAAITLVMPFTLGHFSVAVLSSYLLFLPPDLISQGTRILFG
jgi:hypothetical protein